MQLSQTFLLNFKNLKKPTEMSKAKSAVRNILGDEELSISQEDDSSPDKEDYAYCASAEREEGATDYGLEFTNTNNGSPLINIRGQRRSLRQPQETPVTRHKSHVVQEYIQTNQVTTTTATSSALAANKIISEKQQVAAIRKTRKLKNPVQRKERFLKDVKNLQIQQKILMPRLPFSRLVRELIMAHAVEATKIGRLALEALHEASEIYLTQQLQDAYTLTLHRGRQTLCVSDMELLRFIRGRF